MLIYLGFTSSHKGDWYLLLILTICKHWNFAPLYEIRKLTKVELVIHIASVYIIKFSLQFDMDFSGQVPNPNTYALGRGI